MVGWESEKGSYFLLGPSGETTELSRTNIQAGSWCIVGNVHETPSMIDPELSRVLRHVRGHNGEVKCPVCGGTEFESGGTPEDRQGPIAVDCTRCRHVMLFHTDGIE